MAFSKHLTLVFAALFVAFGLPLVFAEDTGRRHAWGGLALLCLGGFSLSMVRDAIKSGETRLKYTRIKRRDSPWLFWAILGLIATAGIVVLVAAVWLLFFKPR